MSLCRANWKKRPSKKTSRINHDGYRNPSNKQVGHDCRFPRGTTNHPGRTRAQGLSNNPLTSDGLLQNAYLLTIKLQHAIYLSPSCTIYTAYQQSIPNNGSRSWRHTQLLGSVGGRLPGHAMAQFFDKGSGSTMQPLWIRFSSTVF